jgi:hypothetical protein
MRTFLDLPRAVRNIVYEYAIFSLTPRPSTPEDCRFSHYGIEKPCGTSMGYQCVGYPPPRISISGVLLAHRQINLNSETTKILDSLACRNQLFYNIASLALLLANRQINSETSEILESLVRRNQVVYKFDCIIENVGRLFATPLSIPVKASGVATMEVDLRFFGKYDLQRGCAALWSFSLLALLTMVLNRGPHFPKLTEGASTSKLEVGEIVLNFLSLPKVPEWMLSSRMLVRHGEDMYEDQEMGLRMVEREIDGLLDCRVGLPKEDQILYEKVGCIKSMENGKLRREWDLRAMDARNSTS